MERIAAQVRRLLEENGWSYREQEPHTGVQASVVYDMTLCRPVRREWLRQFASVARSLARDPESRRFWGALLVRLTSEEVPQIIDADCAEWLAGDPNGACAALAAAPDPAFDGITPEAAEIVRLYQGLRSPESRRAARRLLEQLYADEVRRPAAPSAAPGGGERHEFALA